MKILVASKISHYQEIEKILKNESKSFAQFPILDKYAKELDNLKSQVSFSSAETVPVQKTNTTLIQERIETYIRLLFNVSMYIDIPKKKDFYGFEWKGYIRKEAFKVRDFYYEIAAMFYNLAVIYFNQGFGILKAGKQEELPIALKYFRTALWSFNESFKSVRKSGLSGTPVPELSFNYITACYNTVHAYANRCLFLILRPKFDKFTSEQQLSLHKSAYESFEKLNKSIEETKNFPFCCGDSEKSRLAGYQVFHFLSTLYKRAKEAEANQKEKVTSGQIGLQIAFIEMMKNCIETFKKNVGTVPDQETADLIKACENEIGKLKDLKHENDEIYHAKVPTAKEIAVIPESEHKVTALDQPHVKVRIEEMSALASKLKSNDFKTLENDFDMILNKNKQNLNALTENVQKTKLQIYQKDNIDVLLRIANSDTSSGELDSKLKEITQVHGGSEGYRYIVDALKQSSEKNDMKAMEMKSLIENDVKSDRAFQQQFGYKLFGLDQPGNQLVSGFEKHGQALTGLRKKDLELIAEFTQVQKILLQIENGSLFGDMQKLKTQLSQSEDLATLIKKDQIIQDIFRLHVKPTEHSLNEYIEKSNTKSLIQEIFFNNKSTDEIYKQINENISDKIEEFRSMIDKLIAALNKMSELAKEINSKMQGGAGALNSQQKVISDVNNTHLYYTLIMANNASNESLGKNADFMQQILKDYLFSKDLQKQEILKNLNAFQNMNLGDYGVSQVQQTNPNYGNNYQFQGNNQFVPGNNNQKGPGRY